MIRCGEVVDIGGNPFVTLEIREWEDPREPRQSPRSIIPAVAMRRQSLRSLALDSASSKRRSYAQGSLLMPGPAEPVQACSDVDGG